MQTIFCDDIREEVSGKITYVGVYSSKMFLSSFPALLPRLCLAINLFTPASQPFRKLVIQLFKDNELLAESTIDESELEKFADAFEGGGEAAEVTTSQSVRAQLIFSPFRLEEPTVLRVRAQTADGELTGPGLRIEQSSETQDPQS